VVQSAGDKMIIYRAGTIPGPDYLSESVFALWDML